MNSQTHLWRLLFCVVYGLAGQFQNISLAGTSARVTPPEAVVDLRTSDGVAAVQGQWRYSETRIREIPHRDVGSDLKATGPANRTYDFEPSAQSAEFDDSSWDILEPTSLEQRRGHGRLSLNWYRLHLTLPKTVEAFETRGSSVVLELVLDDYAEVWVNGRLPYVLGQAGGAVPAGWNAPNRVVLTHDAKPGDHFTIAVLGINGPLSTHPDTYIWVRSATLEFHAPGRLDSVGSVPLDVMRASDELDTIIPAKAQLEQIATGFLFTEGPVWVPEGEGFLLFSDPNANTIYRSSASGDVSVYIPKSGYTGMDIGEYRQPGSNGLTLDPEGRLTIAQHGNRRVVRMEKNGLITVLADRYEGKRLNSPNDLVYRRDGTLFFTDPPFGLPKFDSDSRRELKHAGVYSVKAGVVRLVASDFKGPNGLAFSPDERFLYVGNWDATNKVVYRYIVNPDASLGVGRIFADLTTQPGEDAIDGIKVDARGNVFVSGPSGLWIFGESGKHLGTLRGPEAVHNMAWGDADHRSLYLTAQSGIYRVRLNIPGSGIWNIHGEAARK